MTHSIPGYYKVTVSKDSLLLPFSQKAFDLVILVPSNLQFPLIGQYLHTLLELKTNYHAPSSILIIWVSELSGDGISPLAAFWNYFHAESQFRYVDKTILLEVCPQRKNIPWSDKLFSIFMMMKSLRFSYGLVCTPSSKSPPNAFRMNMLLESTRLSNSDLNLAAYVIPFYKGMLVNFWMMPLSYLFGRQIRNPASCDFVFSQRCLKFWLKLKWPFFSLLGNGYFFLTLSSFTSGLRINEFFLGEKEMEVLYTQEYVPEAIRIGLDLMLRYEKFIRNSTALISSQNNTSSTIPFNIYSASDLNEILNSYDQSKKLPLKKFHLMTRRHLNNEILSMAQAYFKKLNNRTKYHGEYIKSWNFILLALIQSYVTTKSLRKRHDIRNIFNELFTAKPKFWSEEIKRMIQETKEQVRVDESRGFPWYGGESGECWHIHDVFERKLHEDLLLMHALKKHFF